jgi:archaeal flagellar protein FlaI
LSVEEARRINPHLAHYLDEYEKKTGIAPKFFAKLSADDNADPLDIVYPVGDPIFIHVHRDDAKMTYWVVQPELLPEEQQAMANLKQKIFKDALSRPPPTDPATLERELNALFDAVIRSGTSGIVPERVETMRYFLLRDVARYGPLQAFMQDPYLEDIQAVGAGRIHVIHKFFDMMPSNIQFPSVDVVDQYMRNLSERIGRPVSDARPIVDGTLFDGSRINIVYSSDVSRKGPSFSIRRVHQSPISVTQLIKWQTLSAELAAYVWLCLENGMSVFLCGEAACGKSATLNAFLCFINQRSKLFSCEDTPEVRPPHPVWQRLLTRETGPESARVRTFDLLRAALRSRPNYIVVGEIRGAEGAVAFQAMQTGHPTVATFHATDKVKMIQRLGASPINVPVSFIDNLNVAIFQQAMYRNGRLMRRVVSVDEIQGFSGQAGGVITLPVFSYDATHDTHIFKGKNNSYILERKIAEQHGYEDPSEIYNVLNERTAVLKAMVENGVFGFDDVNRLVFLYGEKGLKALPFKVEMPMVEARHH